MENRFFYFFGDVEHPGFELFHYIALDQEGNISRCRLFLNYLLNSFPDSCRLLSCKQLHTHDFDLNLIIPHSHFSSDRNNHSCVDMWIRTFPRTLKSRTGNKAPFVANCENSGTTCLLYLDDPSFDSDEPALHTGVYFG